MRTDPVNALAADTRLDAAALDASMDAVIIVDRQGLILRWNAAAAVMFGRSSDDVLGLELADTIVPPHLRTAHRVGLAQLAAGGPARIRDGRTETVGQRADGSHFPLELTITQIEDRGDVVFVGFLRDITVQRRLLDDLRDSRARLITVSDDTRRRVERDLHDGAQQQLFALAIALGAAREQLGVDVTAAMQTLDRSSAILASAIDELRELARGVHAGLLVSRGLRPAITHLARRSPIEVLVAIESDERLPSVVESSVYYLVAEALTNATKYGAHRVSIDMHLDRAESGTTLVAAIVDDGPGGADPTKGTGLAGMAERLLALGGTVHIDSPLGEGTTLSIAVPVKATDDRSQSV